jgi:hypothetical protein
MGTVARRVPTREMPDWMAPSGLLHFGHEDDRPEAGKQKNISNEKARRVLGWTPRSNEEFIVATAESLQSLGLLRH